MTIGDRIAPLQLLTSTSVADGWARHWRSHALG